MTTMIQPGTIFVSTWGYDQTNVDFYRVTRATAASVWLEPLGQEITEEAGFLAEYVVPTETATGEVFRRKFKTFGETPYVKINDYAGASEWNGQPKMQTHYH